MLETRNLSAASSTAASTRPYYPVLDGVRAVAALMVMCFHFDQEWVHTPGAVLGQTGVDLFFVLSGFLISTILLKAPPRDWQEVRTFFLRRILRIFPLYYGYLTVTALAGVTTAWAYWFYLQNILAGFGSKVPGPEHFWSLGVEEQFYLVWPFVILFSPRRWLPHIIASCIVLSISLRILLMHSNFDVFRFPLTRLDGLAAGSLLACFSVRGLLPSYKPLLATLVAAGGATLAGEWWYTHHHLIFWSEVVKYTAAAALDTGSIGLLISTHETPLHRFLRSRFMRSIGRVSYGLYVFHPILFQHLTPHLGRLPLPAKELICFAAVYVLAEGSYRFYEQPFLRLKARFAPERPYRDVTQAALVSGKERPLAGPAGLGV